MKLRQFATDDLAAILTIQGKNPEAAQWLESDYSSLAKDPRGAILVAELETVIPPKVVGFVAIHRVLDEAELRNIAVDPEHQHQGVGRALLQETRRRLLEAGVKRIFLEVRPSNQQALGLYYSVGFGLHSVRKDFYRGPPEDAYVLSLEIFPPPAVAAAP